VTRVAYAPLSVHLVLLVVQLIFGVNHVVAKAVLARVPPLAVAGLRALVATPLLLGLGWWRDRRLPARRQLPMLAVLGLTGVFANQVLFIEGLKRSTATNAAILQLSIPAFAVAVSLLLRVERVSASRIAGVALAIAGAVAMLRPSQLVLGGEALIGNLLLLANCLSYACFLVLQRPLLAELPWRTMIGWAFAFGGGAVLALSAPSLLALPVSSLPARTWGGLAYIVICATAVGYLLNTWAVQRSSPVTAAVYITAQPVVATALAVLLLGETPGVGEAVGFVLIVAGLALVHRGQPEPR